MTHRPYILAFDTANEVIALGLGVLRPDCAAVDVVACVQVEAHRASNTQLLPRIDALLEREGVAREQIACVACGRGPGSFTGVRICLATAKGVASALDVPLVGVSSLDAVAWECWRAGVRGTLLVAADAMRKEVYPVRFQLADTGVSRLDVDRVVKAAAAAEEFAGANLLVTGDALGKYADLFAGCGQLQGAPLWAPTGEGLLLAVQAAWQQGEVDPFDAVRHNPGFLLPVYTRLSDAEENERKRLAAGSASTLGTHGSRHITMNDTSVPNARADATGIAYKPLDALHTAAVAALEQQLMGTDAWNQALVADELDRPDRSWWVAFAADPAVPVPEDAPVVGYAGVLVVDGDMQVLKVAVAPEYRRRGIAAALLQRVADDARNLAASTCSLEVRASNAGAQALYQALGMRSLGVRPGYYSDHEDAAIFSGDLNEFVRRAGQLAGASTASRVGGMDLLVEGFGTEESFPRPLIFAIESSCDETAAAIVDGAGNLVANVVASQVDFHARFGGVVPEIASRKHIEAICGACQECLDVASARLGQPVSWTSLDAVAVTYAPGLLGALVVGVAFAKGAAWGANKPFIGVNHLEGHLYANKLGTPDLQPPAVVSLVSGGNTLLVHMLDWGSYETLGSTIDDAVGEAFDKVAKALGLGYPGGPIISRYAEQGNPQAISFPRAMLHSGDFRFSLSGLKTAVTTYVNAEREAGRAVDIPNVCASFQQAVVDVQVAKVKTALLQTGAKEFCLGGGVAANPALREAYEALCAELGVRLTMPPLSACTDNAGMIALVALDRYAQGKFFGLDQDAVAHTNLDDPY
ncbi:MAG: tRNA (adenosine(37)-N6)-threonylcarbamoyltransferase complex transferase subunit TsaD [Coriobacteriia bacterium]|nr:tRNA (adenosine(37)-N6)-threonylcarbamoyltransferase complex transferase subunit TsaD [Coriobacteriia bacterium]